MAKRSIQNFAPETLALFQKASVESVFLKFPTENNAKHARQRLYDLRRAMRNEEHYLLPVAEQVQIRVYPADPEGELGWVCECRPADTETGGLADAIRAAGIDLGTPDDAPAPIDPEATDLMSKFRAGG